MKITIEFGDYKAYHHLDYEAAVDLADVLLDKPVSDDATEAFKVLHAGLVRVVGMVMSDE